MANKAYYQNICVGCGLCHSDRGTPLTEDSQGYLTPNFEEGLDKSYFESVCPALHYSNTKEGFHLWGETIGTYEAYSTDETIRFHASSGGALTALSIYLLDKHIVQGIIHTGASSEDPTRTETYVSRTPEEVRSHMGSRYSISSPLKDILSIIKPGERYAFIGKPCDVMALRRYMKNVNDLSSQITLTMSFFCAGMPSKAANMKLLERLGCGKKKLRSLQYRGNGWPGYVTVVDEDDEVYKLDYATAWGKYLGRDVKKICRYCMDGIGEAADIACADLWYLNENRQPDFSEHSGRNIVFSRNSKADELVRHAAQDGYLSAKPFDDMERFSDYQPYQFSRRVTMKSRVLALRLFGRFAPKYSRKLLAEADSYASSTMRIRIFKGTVKRILQGKL